MSKMVRIFASKTYDANPEFLDYLENLAAAPSFLLHHVS
jgi:hypothetical protein